MKTLIVAGDFGGTPRESGIATKLAKRLDADCINGGSVDDLKGVNVSGYECILWMPNVSNEVEKIYPNKDIGAVLICSKVMREGYTHFDSVSRIFKMHGNAVLELHKLDKYDWFLFSLVDALGNIWETTIGLGILCEAIQRFCEWSRGSIRVRMSQAAFFNNLPELPDDLDELVAIVHRVADMAEASRGGRYFGNASTRCMSMFPSQRRADNEIFVSARNTDKQRLTTNDFVPVFNNFGMLYYIGSRKPSVDTPVQMELYRKHSDVNVMIHGHAFVDGAPLTQYYFPCGDMREVNEIHLAMIASGPNGIVNLKGHGFLLYAESVSRMNDIVEHIRIIDLTPKPG